MQEFYDLTSEVAEDFGVNCLVTRKVETGHDLHFELNWHWSFIKLTIMNFSSLFICIC